MSLTHKSVEALIGRDGEKPQKSTNLTRRSGPQSWASPGFKYIREPFICRRAANSAAVQGFKISRV